MGSFGFKTIKDAIVTKLGNATTLKAVYGYDPKSLIGATPVAGIEMDHFTSTFLDTVSDDRIYFYKIRVYFPVDENISADYEDVLALCADEVVKLLDESLTIDGQITDWVEPSNGAWKYGVKDVPVRYFEIIKGCRARVVRGN